MLFSIRNVPKIGFAVLIYMMNVFTKEREKHGGRWLDDSRDFFWNGAINIVLDYWWVQTSIEVGIADEDQTVSI